MIKQQEETLERKQVEAEESGREEAGFGNELERRQCLATNRRAAFSNHRRKTLAESHYAQTSFSSGEASLFVAGTISQQRPNNATWSVGRNLRGRISDRGESS